MAILESHKCMSIIQIVIANLASIYLLMILLYEAQLQTLMGKRAGNAFKSVIYATAVSLLMDMILFLVDGRPGELYYFLNYYGNTVLFALPVVIAWTWLSFIYLFYEGMNETDSKFSFWYKIAILPGLIIIGLSVLQIFTPVFYTVDEVNVYHRLHMGWLSVAVMLFYILFGFCMFYYGKEYRRFRTGNIMLFFIPIIAGTFFQFLFKGVSTIYTSVTIGLTGFYLSCHNELLMRDWLTGLLNRTCFLATRTRRQISKHQNVGFIVFDIDDFKSINDQYGHPEGDRSLQAIANILREEADTNDWVFRISGDEFLIISFSHNEEGLKQMGLRIRERLAAPNENNERDYPLMVSFGTAVWEKGGDLDFDSVIRKADESLYVMKEKKGTLR